MSFKRFTKYSGGIVLLAAVLFSASSSLHARTLYEAIFPGAELTETLRLAPPENPWTASLTTVRQYNFLSVGTYGGWFKVPNLSSERDLFRLVTNTGNPNVDGSGILVKQLTSGKIRVMKSGVSSYTVDTSNTVTPGEWFYMALVATPYYGGSNSRILVGLSLNGTLTTGNIYGEMQLTTPTEFWLGASGVSLGGFMVDTAMLSLKQIERRMNALRQPMDERLWNGGAESAAWNETTANWFDSAGFSAFFAQGLPSRFTVASPVKDVVVEDAVYTSRMVVEGADYSFMGAAIATPRLTIENDASATLPALSANHPARTARHIKLVLTGNTDTRNTTSGNEKRVAVSEIVMMLGAVPLPWPEGTTVVAGPNTNAATTGNESTLSLIDGTFGPSTGAAPTGSQINYNKFIAQDVTLAKYLAEEIYAVISLPEDESITFDGYRLCLTDNTQYNPAGWILYTSEDGQTWELFDERGGDRTYATQTNTWYGDLAKATSGTLPAAAEPRPVAINVGGNLSAGLSSPVTLEKTGSGMLTLTGDNTAFSGLITVENGKVDLGKNNATPKSIILNAGTTGLWHLDVNTACSLGPVNGTGILELDLTCVSTVNISGTLSGGVHLLTPTVGKDTKLRLSPSTIPSANWITVYPGMQAWVDASGTVNAKLRLAGDGGDGTIGEAFGGALRIQSGNFSGSIELIDSATITSYARTCSATITVAESVEESPTLRLGVSSQSHNSVSTNLRQTGAISGRADLPLNLWVNGNTVTLAAGATNMGELKVATRAVSGSVSVGGTALTLEGTQVAPMRYEFNRVLLGDGTAKTESLTVGAYATLAVSGAINGDDATATLNVNENATLSYSSGTLAGILSLKAGATLVPTLSADPLFSVGTVMLPGDGTVELVFDESLVSSGPAYFLTAGNAASIPLNAFSGIPEGISLLKGIKGLYLTRAKGIMITLY